MSIKLALLAADAYGRDGAFLRSRAVTPAEIGFQPLSTVRGGVELYARVCRAAPSGRQ